MFLHKEHRGKRSRASEQAKVPQGLYRSFDVTPNV